MPMTAGTREPARLSPEARSRLLDGRMVMIKETLKLNDTQLRLWAPVEQHIRARTADRLSASYLIALAARVVQEVSDLVRLAQEADKYLPTLSIDSEVRFRSAAERAAFTADLTSVVTELVARYHDASSPGGRSPQRDSR